MKLIKIFLILIIAAFILISSAACNQNNGDSDNNSGKEDKPTRNGIEPIYRFNPIPLKTLPLFR